MANTPPSPVSSWTLDAQAVGDGMHPLPAPVWPGSTKSLTVQDAGCGGTLHLKMAQENETLQLWLEDASTKRQFYVSLAKEECKAIVKDTLEPNSLLEMLKVALAATGEAGEELSASFEWGPSQVTLILHLHYTWVAKTFRFPLEERDVGQVDRLERRVDDMLEKQAEHGAKIKECVDALKADAADTYRKQEIDQQLAGKADVEQLAGKADVQQLAGKADAADTYRKQEIDQLMARRDEEAKRAELSCWSLHVSNPYEYGEGCYTGHFAMSGNHFLIQDVDYTTKKAGAITNTGSAGFIQATFPKPVHVSTVKIAALRNHRADGISGGSVTLSVQSPETGEFETLRQDIHTTKEEVFPVDNTILALRLSGTYLTISKLIFS